LLKIEVSQRGVDPETPVIDEDEEVEEQMLTKSSKKLRVKREDAPNTNVNSMVPDDAMVEEL
jgi:hypothetical protein